MGALGFQPNLTEPNVVDQTMAHPRGLDPTLSDNYWGVKFTAKNET